MLKISVSPLLRGRSGREMRTGWLGAGRRMNPGLAWSIKMGLSLLQRGRSGREGRTGWLEAGRRMDPGLPRSIKDGAKPAPERQVRKRREDRMVGSR